MTRTSLGTALVTLLCAGATCGATCVRGEEPEYDCSKQDEAFMEAFASDGKLLDEIPDRPYYPMAMVISEVGLNELVTSAVGDQVPLASSVQFGPAKLNFTPTSAPVLSIEEVPNCSRCVLFYVDFSFGLTDSIDEPAGAGVGTAQITLPLNLEENDDGSSSLVVDYTRSKVLLWDFSTMGFHSEDHEPLADAIKILVTQAIREQFGVTELLRFQPWSIGDGDVALAAREFAIYPENKVLSLALQTNLDLPSDVAVAVGDSLPEGVPMGLSMAPGMLLGMAQRMIVEGKISRTYNEQGEPDPDGLYGVTLEAMGASETPGAKNLLDVKFRVWRTDDGYCGYADAITGLKLDLDPAGTTIKVVPTGDLRVTGGEGVGEIAATDMELVEKNKKLVEAFQKDLSEQIGITLNYDEIGVEGSRIVFDADALLVDKRKIDIYIDFTVVAAEDP